jgi:2-amino-4-hydroxy-6-hydroxymethyldihydropteridine diphosphokinase
MHDVFLGIGSNVGDRVHFLASAVRKLKTLPSTELLKFSSVYETEPVGIKEQNNFLNAALWIQTSIDVKDFHTRTKAIEKEIGRQKSIRWGPREIDIDILLFADLIIDEPVLRIPHRDMLTRKFVLQPLAEIAPGVIHPTSRISISELLAQCTDQSAVDRSEQLTKIFSHLCEE